MRLKQDKNGLFKKGHGLFGFAKDTKDPYPDGEPLEVVFSKTKISDDGTASLEFDFSCKVCNERNKLGNPVVIYNKGKIIAVCASVAEAGNFLDISPAKALSIIKRGGVWRHNILTRISQEQFMKIYNCEIPI